MSFQITGLDAAPFRRFYGLSDDELQSVGVKRLIADTSPGFPDRIELRDVEQGEALLLLNYLHQPADTPYRASHAIFVREWAETPYQAPVTSRSEVLTDPPDFAARLRRRGRHGRRRSDCRRATSSPTIARLFANPEAALHPCALRQARLLRGADRSGVSARGAALRPPQLRDLRPWDRTTPRSPCPAARQPVIFVPHGGGPVLLDRVPAALRPARLGQPARLPGRRSQVPARAAEGVPGRHRPIGRRTSRRSASTRSRACSTIITAFPRTRIS